eukprot:Gregarina_sp_Pseudo_9__2900@NODE_311_length_3202_cov_8_377806_g292_i0_p3_GENE_NODE_311_length_3202_cov_8_377806_g292_i0NODE_311_length_3202_cov_8_377806_g292_i0_p3_ORF_typecomplete_len169_score51_65_NODE_311_length_3202_cov_8_377806_g292_i018052311
MSSSQASFNNEPPSASQQRISLLDQQEEEGFVSDARPVSVSVSVSSDPRHLWRMTLPVSSSPFAARKPVLRARASTDAPSLHHRSLTEHQPISKRNTLQPQHFAPPALLKRDAVSRALSKTRSHPVSPANAPSSPALLLQSRFCQTPRTRTAAGTRLVVTRLPASWPP